MSLAVVLVPEVFVPFVKMCDEIEMQGLVQHGNWMYFLVAKNLCLIWAAGVSCDCLVVEKRSLCFCLLNKSDGSCN